MPPHGSCAGNHNHDDTPEMGIEYSLYEKIDKQQLECLNEAEENSGKTVFKPWSERLNLDTVSVLFFKEAIEICCVLHSVWRAIVTLNCYSTSRSRAM